MARKHNQNKINKSFLAILLLLAVIIFIAVGNRFAQEKVAEPVEVAEDVSQTSSIYQDVLEEYDLAEPESKVSQVEEPGKNDHSSQASDSSENSQSSANSSQSQAQSSAQQADSQVDPAAVHASLPKVPAGQAYVEVNENVPIFTNDDLSQVDEGWEQYGPLDDLGRVTPANALLSVDLMPAESEERESLTSITPTGWQQNRYESVSGGWLYNRSHLIGFQLTGQQDNLLNLMTGTRYFNVEGMLPFENYVAAYVEDTENHVRYRITPLFLDDELLARGIFMEAYSIEDDGDLQFHVFVPNIQPDIELDYQNGRNQVAE